MDWLLYDQSRLFQVYLQKGVDGVLGLYILATNSSKHSNGTGVHRMITMTKALAKVALAVEAGKLDIEDATVLCSDLMGVYEYLRDEKISYEVATRQIASLLRGAGIAT